MSLSTGWIEVLIHVFGDVGGGHFKLVYDVKCFLNIKGQGFEAGVDVYFTLLRYHVLSDNVQISK